MSEPIGTLPIKWLTDVNGDRFFPVAHVKGAKDDNWVGLDVIIGGISEISANDRLFTIQRNWVTVGTFDANDSDGKTVNITVTATQVNSDWNHQLDPPYAHPAPDVSAYATKKAAELKEACCGAVQVTALEYAMAIGKAQSITADSYYTLSDVKSVIASFRSQSKSAMQVYDTYKPQMESASTVEAVDALYKVAIGALAQYRAALAFYNTLSWKVLF